MVTLIFTFCPKSGQVRVKRPTFWNSKSYLRNLLILSSFVSGFQKCHNWLTTIKIAKNRCTTSDVITLTCFFLPITHQRIKILSWHCVRMLLTYGSMLYIQFIIHSKMLFYRNLFLQTEILIFRVKTHPHIKTLES